MEHLTSDGTSTTREADEYRAVDSSKMEALHLDYEQTTEQIRILTDIRFKLLAFVPTLTGVAVSLLTGGKVGTGTVLAVGILGFVVTLGIIIYELRNSLFYDLSFLRASHLEQKLHFPNFTHINEAWSGGVFTERPASGDPPSQKFLGIISIKHDSGLAFAYGASLGGWTFLVINTIPLNEPWRSLVSLVAGILVAGITIWEFRSLDKRRNWAGLIKPQEKERR